MREILFRGKYYTGAWIYGDFLHPNIIRQNDRWHEQYEVDPDTIGQFTGLYNRNNKGIYEGDILEDKWKTHRLVCYGEHEVETYEDPVTVDDGFYVVCNYPYRKEQRLSDYYLYSEVIGNIFDNPELLKEKDND